MTKTTKNSQSKLYRAFNKMAMVITSMILTITPEVAAKNETAVVMMTDYHYNKDADDQFKKLIDQLAIKYASIVIVMNGDNEVKTPGVGIFAKTLGIGTKDLNHKRVPTNDMIHQWKEFENMVAESKLKPETISMVQGEIAGRLFYEMMHNAHEKAGGTFNLWALRKFLSCYKDNRAHWYDGLQITTHGKILRSFLTLSEREPELKNKLLSIVQMLHDRSGPKPRNELLEKIHKIKNVKEIVIGLGNHEIALKKNLGFYMKKMKELYHKVHFVGTLPWKEKYGIAGSYVSKVTNLGFVQWTDPVKLKLDSGDMLENGELEVTEKDVNEKSVSKKIKVMDTVSYETTVKTNLNDAATPDAKHLFVLAHQDLSDVEIQESYKTIENHEEKNKIYYNHEGMYTLKKLDAKSVMSRLIESEQHQKHTTVVCGHGHKAGRQVLTEGKVTYVTPDPYGISVTVVAINEEGQYSQLEDLKALDRDIVEYYPSGNLIARIMLRNVDGLMTKNQKTIAKTIEEGDTDEVLSFSIGKGPHNDGTWDLDE